MKTPERTTAKAFPRYAMGQVAADSASLHWTGLFVRRYRFPRAVERFLVPATPEPLIVCQLSGRAEFLERDLGQPWVRRELQRGDIFVTHSQVPYEVRFSSPPGHELEAIAIHLAVDELRLALEAVYPGQAEAAGVIDFFGRDEALAHHCYACAEMIAERVSGESARVAALTRLIGAHLAEQYSNTAAVRKDLRGGLPVRQIHRLEDHVRSRLAEEITVNLLAELLELSPFHFSRAFKEATGMSPMQFVTRERIARAQQLICETSRNLIEIGFEVGYGNPSHFARVFRKVAGVTPTEFRNSL